QGPHPHEDGGDVHRRPVLAEQAPLGVREPAQDVDLLEHEVALGQLVLGGPVRDSRRCAVGRGDVGGDRGLRGGGVVVVPRGGAGGGRGGRRGRRPGGRGRLGVLVPLVVVDVVGDVVVGALPAGVVLARTGAAGGGLLLVLAGGRRGLRGGGASGHGRGSGARPGARLVHRLVDR